jgi:hypothetical protein
MRFRPQDRSRGAVDELAERQQQRLEQRRAAIAKLRAAWRARQARQEPAPAK